MRRIVLLALFAFPTALASSAHAEPITYQTLGNVGTDSSNYKPQLENLTRINSDPGNSPLGSASALFIDQALVGFGSSGDTLDHLIDLTLSPIYYKFQGLPKGLSSQAYMTASTDPPSTPAPEPASIFFLLTGMAIMVVLLRRGTVTSSL
jgi:hypothetical protein